MDGRTGERDTNGWTNIEQTEGQTEADEQRGNGRQERMARPKYRRTDGRADRDRQIDRHKRNERMDGPKYRGTYGRADRQKVDEDTNRSTRTKEHTPYALKMN